ncbi:MAG: radical SAM protein [Candidatus Pacearchaeota archaeon]|jgi:radical SAM superfamily enzyme YgiQ (UPF0313 family)
MAKVLFIQCNYDIRDIKEGSSFMPLALVELATFMREKGGHKVKILDRNIHYHDEELLKVLKEFNPDIVGMTCYTSQVIVDVMRVSKITKENSSAMVIIGGIHATLEPKSLLDFKYIDYIIRGEGEYPLLEICDLIDKGKGDKKSILKIKNVNYNPMRPIINLNDLPIPDYDLLEVKKYPIATFYTSRGCPGRCRFCYNQGRALRFYNTQKTIQSITRVLDKYKIREFTIADDNFANMSNRTTEICNALSKYNAIFHCFLRVDQTHDKVMRDLKRAGCWSIQFGFESGSQRVLDFINKDTKMEQNIKAIEQCKKYGIFVDGSFMLGLPTETIADMRQTVGFIKKFKPDAVDVKVYKPFPSTELYNYSIEKKLIEQPKTLNDWVKFCDLKSGEPNVSDIPTGLLVKTVDELSKTSNKIYLKKAYLLLRNRHWNYTLFKTKSILKQKLHLK